MVVNKSIWLRNRLRKRSYFLPTKEYDRSFFARETIIILQKCKQLYSLEILDVLICYGFYPVQVRNKKRWSQIMYMSYVIDFKKEEDNRKLL